MENTMELRIIAENPFLTKLQAFKVKNYTSSIDMPKAKTKR